MAYAVALEKAWQEVADVTGQNILSVKFLADEYSVDCDKKSIMSLSCNVPAKEFTAIILLHYIARKYKGLPALTGKWLTFREFSGIEGYFDAFKKRSIEPIIRKYGKNPEGILEVLKRLPSRRAEGGDIGIIVDAFEGVPALIKLWKSDEEFGPDANIYFDASVTQIFCTEDIVVLAGMVAGAL